MYYENKPAPGRRRKARLRRTAAAAALTLLLAPPAALAAPYNGYMYDAWNQPVPAPMGYLPELSFGGATLGTVEMKTPSDLFVDAAGTVYIADTGNNRVLCLSPELELQRILDTVVDEDGAQQPLESPSGLFADGEGGLYVAQKDKGQVIRLDPQGRIAARFAQPVSELIPENFVFAPSKVLVNRNGTVFVLVDGFYLGALTYDGDGNFLGFYGSNRVEVTVKLLADYLWKQLLSQKQKDQMARYVPVQYTNFDIDGENFIYTCTQTTRTSLNEIRKINTLGNDVLIPYPRNVESATGNYGDLQTAWFMGQSTDTQFVDICVDADGMINGLDFSRGRIFQYDSEGKLLTIAGGSGDQLGLFEKPAAIDDLGEKLLVLDAAKNTVTVLAPTAYGRLLHQGILLYNEGESAQAKTVWEEVLARNVNCELAYVGLGKAYYEAGDYAAAMEAFEYGYDREGYSRAYKEYRTVLLRRYFPYIMTGLAAAALAGLVFFGVRRRKRKAGEDR